ncbi:hypothetical protein [Pseudoalteromonas phage vB_PtuP_Slicky01]|nr:hypothetical protein [Pseudoalteromonas phage vB_PtuP_Slicky01]
MIIITKGQLIMKYHQIIVDYAGVQVLASSDTLEFENELPTVKGRMSALLARVDAKDSLDGKSSLVSVTYDSSLEDKDQVADMFDLVLSYCNIMDIVNDANPRGLDFA